MVLKTTYDRQYGASRRFSHTNASLASGAVHFFNWEDEDGTSRKYLPFNEIRIINNSSQALIVYPNQDQSNPNHVPAGTISSLNRYNVPAVWGIGYKNNGTSTINAGEIIIESAKSGEELDTVFSRTHRRVLQFLRGELDERRV